MRKASVFLTTLILAALLLAACGGEETATLEPGTEVPPVTAVFTPTDDAVDDVSETVEPADLTPTAAIPVTGEESPSRLSNLLEYEVWNQDEQIGDVDDIVLDMDSNVIQYVIVGTGGFLELGEKEVFVPWDMLEFRISPDDGDLLGAGENGFVYTGEQDAFNNAPDIDVNNVLPELGTAAEDWDADIRAFWETGVLPDDQAATETETPAAEATAVPDMTATVDPNLGGEGAVEGTELQGVMLASNVIGSTIQVGGGQAMEPGEGLATADPNATATLGPDPGTVPDVAETMEVTIEDVIVDPQTGDVQYLVINGDFAESDRLIPVPLSAVQWNESNQNFMLDMNSADLQAAPAFEGGLFPNFPDEAWDDDIDSFWDGLGLQ